MPYWVRSMAGNAADDAGGTVLTTSDGHQPTTWLDVFEDVLDEIVEGEDTVEASFDDLRVDVPLRYGDDAPRAEWGFDGTMRVHVEGMRGPLAEWLRWWYRNVE